MGHLKQQVLSLNSLAGLWSKKNYEELKVPNHEIVGAKQLSLFKNGFSSCLNANGSSLVTQDLLKRSPDSAYFGLLVFFFFVVNPIVGHTEVATSYVQCPE